jgi:RNA polymerase sigma-70 factor (ECF subfamily)
MLHGYILSLIGSLNEADDVLQNTNVVLLSKSSEFKAGTNFTAWACRIAFYQVMAHLKRQKRETLRFDDHLLAQLAEQAEREMQPEDDQAAALRHCLRHLSSRNRDLVERRYAEHGSVEAMSRALGRSAGSISVTLHRIRLALRNCIDRQLARERA